MSYNWSYHKVIYTRSVILISQRHTLSVWVKFLFFVLNRSLWNLASPQLFYCLVSQQIYDTSIFWLWCPSLPWQTRRMKQSANGLWPLLVVFLEEIVDGGSKLCCIFQTLEEGYILAQTSTVPLRKIMKVPPKISCFFMKPCFIPILGTCGWGLGHEEPTG